MPQNQELQKENKCFTDWTVKTSSFADLLDVKDF